jgi:heat-inducible transcriptional repressor
MRLKTVEKEKEVLLGIVDLYIKLSKPVGSQTLKDTTFKSVSSATLRNYCSKLEKSGYLVQHHSSSGRIPTPKAFCYYADKMLEESLETNSPTTERSSFIESDNKDVAYYLQQAAETLSQQTNCASFIISPRFDQDFISKIQLISVDETRLLSIISTDFGSIHTQLLHVNEKQSQFALKRIEEYFHFCLTGLDEPNLDNTELNLAKRLYNEVALRHFVSYTNMYQEDVYKAGFASLLNYPEYHDPEVLSEMLSFFDHPIKLQKILKQCMQKEGLSFWIAQDLEELSHHAKNSSLIAIPYYIHQKLVGAIAILGPMRMPYKKNFTILSDAAKSISNCLTKIIYKYKITYRQSQSTLLEAKTHEPKMIALAHNRLIKKKKKR